MTQDIAQLGFEMNTGGLVAGNRELSKLKPTAKGVEKAAANLNSTLSKTDNNLKRVASGANVTSKAFKGAAGATKILRNGLIGIATGVIATFAFSNMISGARELSSSLSELSTLLPSGSKGLNEMRDAARGMADEFGTNAAFQVDAFYGAVSAGASDAASAIKIVDQANKLAIGGITDVGTGVDILTTSLNAYAEKGLKAVDASDALFVGMKDGKTTIGQLATSLGNVIPISAALGVEFDELVAGTAALTKSGLNTSTAVTSLRAIMSGVAKPTAEASKLAKKLGLDFSATALRTKGLANFLKDVMDKTGGSADQLSLLFGSVEALNAALAFAGPAGVEFGNILDNMAEKAGATDEAFIKVTSSLDHRWGVILSKITNLSIDFGNSLLSVLVPAVENAGKLFAIAADNSDILAIALGVLTVTQLPALATGFIRLAAALTSYNAIAIYSAVASRALAVAMYAIPFVAVVAGLTALYRWFNSSSNASTIFTNSIERSSIGSGELSDNLKTVVDGLGATESAMLSISKTEALIAQTKYTEEYERSLIPVILKLTQLKGLLAESDETKGLFDQIIAGVKSGKIEMSGLIEEFDRIGVSNEALRPWISGLIDAANKTQILSDKTKRAGALFRYLNRQATAADLALLGVTKTAGSTGGAIASIAHNFDPVITAAQNLYALMQSVLGLVGKLPGALGAIGTVTSNIKGALGGLVDKVSGSNALGNFKGYLTGVWNEANKAGASVDSLKTKFFTNDVAGGGGTGGGGGGIVERLTELQEISKSIDDISEPFNQATDAFNTSKTALENGILTNKAYAESLSEIEAAFLRAGGTSNQWAKIVSNDSETVGSKMKDLAEKSINDLGESFIDLAVEGKASFADLARSIIKDLFRIAMQALIVKPLLKALGLADGGVISGGSLKPVPNALGNAFDDTNVVPFKSGGTFTNSVVNSPTPFMFAKGGALGVMGEAGPEAVMPLQRGPDGSLGVQMYDSGSQRNKPTAGDVQISNNYQIEGAISSDEITAAIQRSGEQTSEQVKQSLVGWIDEYNTNGGL